MQVIVKPSKLSGVINTPPSKSMMQRACAAALLYKGTCIINNIGTSADDKVALSVIQQLGATINYHSDSSIKVTSNGDVNANGEINCGESGLSTRLFTIIAALSSSELTITGSGSLLNRSMTPFVDLFEQLGVTIKEFGGTLPITIKGPLVPQSIVVDGRLSSQFLSGLLIAYAFTTKEYVAINVTKLVSRPYVDMTLEVLASFGKWVTNNEYKEFIVHPAVRNGKEVVIDVEGDWSSASFWLIAGALNGDIKLSGLSVQSSQADKTVLSVLKDSGIDYTVDGDTISVQSLLNRPNSFVFDATHSPDLFPILAIYAALCNGESEIKGLHRLRQKESDRAKTIKSMLDGFGVSYTTKDDSLLITGQRVLQAATIDSYNDHRIAMAASIGALNADGSSTIKNAEAVKKSYTHFFEDLHSLGGYCKQV